MTLFFDDDRLRRFGCRFVDEVFGEKRETGAEGDESSLEGFIRHLGWVFSFRSVTLRRKLRGWLSKRWKGLHDADCIGGAWVFLIASTDGWIKSRFEY